MKVTRREEKLFHVLVDPIKESIDERKMEGQLNYYYQRLDTQDLVVAGCTRCGRLLSAIGGVRAPCAVHNLLCERILIKCFSRKK